MAVLLALPGAARAQSLFDERLAAEDAAPFPLVPHRPNFWLPWSYQTRPNQAAFQQAVTETGKHLQHAESKFQVSVKLPLWKDAFGVEGLRLNAAYTQLSLWQIYNRDASTPFRDTNYEPELFFTKVTDEPALGLRLRSLTMGVVHQSNGRGSQSVTRSWNRVFWEAVAERGPFQLRLKPWWRFPDSPDDNPGITNYLGCFEARAAYKWKKSVFSALWRNNLQFNAQNRGAVELGWSYPIKRGFRWYVQYFNGYGESLVDYNHANERVGAGFLLGEWL